MVKICDKCVNCGLCYKTCPFSAIEMAGTEWIDNGGQVNEPLSKDHFFINPAKCRKCLRCVDVCPIRNICEDDCCEDSYCGNSSSSAGDAVDNFDDDLI